MNELKILTYANGSEQNWLQRHKNIFKKFKMKQIRYSLFKKKNNVLK